MSGSSLDGLDLCLCQFGYNNNRWSYTIIAADTVLYPENIKVQLANAQFMSALELVRFHSGYGRHIGQVAKQFIAKQNIKPELIASHGHTIFHQPSEGFTFQIGSGAHIAIEAGINAVCDFRTNDVAAGGQGAPLVPIGDRHLFGQYGYCLNLGGFANISYEEQGQRLAYDICPVNYVLNHYTRAIGKEYDNKGEIATKGKVHPELLEALNHLDFYRQQGPKSLGREWVEQSIFPLIESYNLPLEDKLSTFCEHVALQVGAKLNSNNSKILVTGGGAFNTYLMSQIQAYSVATVYIPDKLTINFKEALIFAFLGLLYAENQPNCLASVTDAHSDVIGGAMYKIKN
jgi:anhydro-N-acetylmuramic acid kinase